MSEQPISAIADVNPSVRIPKGLSGIEAVSFIPMADVSESGQWINQQTRQLRSVSHGFTSFEEGDVLIAKITPCLENGKGAHAAGLTNGIGFGSTEFHVLRARPGFNSRFLYHLCQWRKLRVAAESQMVGSAGQQRVQRQFFDEFRVAAIGAADQARIAQVLDTLDTATHETEAIIAKLKAVKQGLLHDLLTRGIDANGELRPPQAEAPHLYKQSPLGWIPEEWMASSVEAEFYVDSGITLGQHRVPRQKPRPYLRVANVHRAKLKLADIAFLEASDSEAKEKSLQSGDLLVVEGHASTDEIGRCAIADQEVTGYLFQNHLFRLRPKRMRNTFALLWMNSRFVRNYWKTEAATSSGLNTINKTKLNVLSVAVPSTEEQERIAVTAETFDIRIFGEETILKKFQQEKTGLMDDLLTGRVRVTPLLEATP